MHPHFDFLASNAGIFLEHFTSPFADCHLGMTIAIEQRWGSMHGMLFLQERLSVVTWADTGSCDAGTRCLMRVRLQIAMQTPCSTTAFIWLTKSGQCHLFPQIRGWCAAWSLSNRSTLSSCVLSLNLPIRKSCLTSVLVWPLRLHLIDGCTGAWHSCCQHWRPNSRTAYKHRLRRCSVRQKFQDDSFLASWTMLAEYRRSGSDFLEEFQWRVHCGLESSEITCNSHCWLEEAVLCLRGWDFSSAVESSCHGNQIPKNS